MRNKMKQTGFSLVELLIAMTISLILVFACSSVYSSLHNTLSLAKSLSEAQESLRTAHYVMSRSVRQGYELAVLGSSSTQKLIVTYGSEANGSTIFYGCLGAQQLSGATDTFFVDNDHLYCTTETEAGVIIGSEVIALNVKSIFATLAAAPNKGVKVSLAIEGMPGDMANNGFTFTLAMRQRILIDASVEGASSGNL